MIRRPDAQPPGVLSPRVKLPRREADHSLQSSAEAANEWVSPYFCMVWYLIKQTSNFPFTILRVLKYIFSLTLHL